MPYKDLKKRKEFHKQYNLKRKETHREQMLKNKKNWYKTLKGIAYGKFQNKRWRKNNRERACFLHNKRRCLLLNAEGCHTFYEWENLKAQYNWTCPCCGKKEPNINLTEDHIIPLSKGGSNNIENIQPLCKSCNCHKHTKIIKYDVILA